VVPEPTLAITIADAPIQQSDPISTCPTAEPTMRPRLSGSCWRRPLGISTCEAIWVLGPMGAHPIMQELPIETLFPTDASRLEKKLPKEMTVSSEHSLRVST